MEILVCTALHCSIQHAVSVRRNLCHHKEKQQVTSFACGWQNSKFEHRASKHCIFYARVCVNYAVPTKRGLISAGSKGGTLQFFFGRLSKFGLGNLREKCRLSNIFLGGLHQKSWRVFRGLRGTCNNLWVAPKPIHITRDAGEKKT